MPYIGSLRNRVSLGLGLLVDNLERRTPLLDKWMLFIGLILGAVAAMVTYLHHKWPKDSLTEDCIAEIATSIRTVHRWMHLPLADLITYAAVVLSALGAMLWLVKYGAHKGDAKSP